MERQQAIKSKEMYFIVKRKMILLHLAKIKKITLLGSLSFNVYWYESGFRMDIIHIQPLQGCRSMGYEIAIHVESLRDSENHFHFSINVNRAGQE